MSLLIAQIIECTEKTIWYFSTQSFACYFKEHFPRWTWPGVTSPGPGSPYNILKLKFGEECIRILPLSYIQHKLLIAKDSGVRTDPDQLSSLGEYLRGNNRWNESKSSWNYQYSVLLRIMTKSFALRIISDVPISVCQGSVRTPKNWMRVN